MKLGTALLTWGYEKADLAVVVGHSRSPFTLSNDAALEIARDELSEGAQRVDSARWFSVTKKQVLDNDAPEEAEVGSYCTEGRGSAWVDVALFADRCPPTKSNPSDGGES